MRDDRKKHQKQGDCHCAGFGSEKHCARVARRAGTPRGRAVQSDYTAAEKAVESTSQGGEKARGLCRDAKYIGSISQ